MLLRPFVLIVLFIVLFFQSSVGSRLLFDIIPNESSCQSTSIICSNNAQNTPTFSIVSDYEFQITVPSYGNFSAFVCLDTEAIVEPNSQFITFSQGASSGSWVFGDWMTQAAGVNDGTCISLSMWFKPSGSSSVWSKSIQTFNTSTPSRYPVMIGSEQPPFVGTTNLIIKPTAFTFTRISILASAFVAPDKATGVGSLMDLPLFTNLIQIPYPPSTFNYSSWFPYNTHPLLFYKYVTHQLAPFPSTQAQIDFFNCYNLYTVNSDQSLVQIYSTDYPPSIPSVPSFMFEPLESCQVDFIHFPFVRQNQEDATTSSHSTTLNLTLINIPHSPVTSLVPPNVELFQMQIFTQPSPYHIDSISFPQLPTDGEIFISSKLLDETMLNQSYQISSSRIFFKLPSCTRADDGSSSNCINTLVPLDAKSQATFPIIAHSGSRTSQPITQVIQFSTSGYEANSITTSVPAQRLSPITFVRARFDPLSPSFLDDFVVVIHSLPINGTIFCSPYCSSPPCELVEVKDVPFIALNNLACQYNASHFSLDPAVVYDSIEWFPSHKTAPIGSSVPSIMQFDSKRINSPPVGVMEQNEYWAQAGISTALNYTINDPDWSIPSSNSQYLVKLASNPCLRIYPSTLLSNSVDLLAISTTAVEFSANQTTINEYLKGVTLAGADSCVAELVITIEDTDTSAWNGFSPSISSSLIANILTGHQDSETKPTANSTIKNSALLLSIVIGVPILLAIIVIIVCIRRKKRRQDLEQKRLALIQQRQTQLLESMGEEGSKVGTKETPQQSQLSKPSIELSSTPSQQAESSLATESTMS